MYDYDVILQYIIIRIIKYPTAHDEGPVLWRCGQSQGVLCAECTWELDLHSGASLHKLRILRLVSDSVPGTREVWRASSTKLARAQMTF